MERTPRRSAPDPDPALLRRAHDRGRDARAGRVANAWDHSPGKDAVCAVAVRLLQRALLLKLEYATEMFETSQIEELLGLVRLLLEVMPRDAAAEVCSLPTVTPEARERLRGWGRAPLGLAEDRALPALIEAQAERRPDEIALVAEEQSETTYRELNERANRLAHLLISRGLRSEACVGIAMPPSAEMVIAALAVMKAGAAYVPLDPSYPEGRLAMMIEDARPMLILSTGARANDLPLGLAQLLRLEDLEQSLQPRQIRWSRSARDPPQSSSSPRGPRAAPKEWRSPPAASRTTMPALSGNGDRAGRPGPRRSTVNSMRRSKRCSCLSPRAQPW